MLFDYLSCIVGIIKIFFYKIIYFNRIKFNSIPKISNGFLFAIKKKSFLIIGKSCRTRKNFNVRIYDEGKIILGDNCFFNDNCSLNCRKKIVVGNNFKSGQNLLIFDNDHDYKGDIDSYVCDEVVIGNNVWIGANCIILKGVHIGNNVVIAAGTIVKENVEDNCIYFNERKSKVKKVVKK